MPSCAICDTTVPHWLGDHLAETHGMSPDTYAAKYPGRALSSPALAAAYEQRTTATRREHPPAVEDLSVQFGALTFQFNANVPEDACLPEPPNYRIPSLGALGNDVNMALVSLARARSTYVWGLPGTGKDALFHAWSYRTRTPAIIKQVIPGTDIEAWFFSRGFDENGTVWEEGDVLQALRDGYVCEDGSRIPYLLLISDIDRADRAQAEHFRLITDSIKGRISGPTGRTYPVLPGTRIVATANTPGSGDPRGRMVSSNPIDASILDRFERKYQFHYMDWKDEEPIIRDKFPLLAERAPWVFQAMGHITGVIRDAVAQEDIYTEFSHRALCSILGHADDLLHFYTSKTSVPNTLLAKASRAWMDGLPDQMTRDKVTALISPHLKGGMIKQGSTSHIGKGKPLADV